MHLRAHRGLAALSVALLALSQGALAQVGEQQFADIGDFKLQSGKVIPHCRIGYRTYGLLNADRSNAVLFPTWFGGTSADLDGSIGAGRLVDPAGLFVVAVDALGNGVSSSPSNCKEFPGSKFPAITIHDMVESQHRLVVDALKIPHLKAVVGISMGGMQTFQWMVSYPNFLDRAVPIVGSPRLTSQDLLLWKAELRTIEDHRGPPDLVKKGLQAVARIHALNLNSPTYHVQHTKRDSVDKLLDSQEQGVANHDAEDWAAQLGAMIGQDIFHDFNGSEEAAAKAVKARALVVVVLSDQMVNPWPAVDFAKKIHAKTLELNNNGGHLGTALEMDAVISALRPFIYGRD